jgi:hypothetical protein
VEPATNKDLAMVSAENFEDVVRDYTRAAKVLIAIGLRILDKERDEPDPGLRPSFN